MKDNAGFIKKIYIQTDLKWRKVNCYLNDEI